MNHKHDTEWKKSPISFKITKLIKLSLKSQYGKFGEGNGNPLQYSCLENLMEGSLACYSPRGHKDSDTTEVTWHSTR